MPAFYQVQEPGLLFAFHRVPDLQGFTLAASSYFCLKHFALLGILRWRISNLVSLPFSSYIFPSYIFIICTIYHLSASYLLTIQVSFNHPSINNDFRSVYNHGFLFYSVSNCLILMVGYSFRMALRSLAICPHIESALDPFCMEGWEDFSVSCILFW